MFLFIYDNIALDEKISNFFLYYNNKQPQQMNTVKKLNKLLISKIYHIKFFVEFSLNGLKCSS